VCDTCYMSHRVVGGGGGGPTLPSQWGKADAQQTEGEVGYEYMHLLSILMRGLTEMKFWYRMRQAIRARKRVCVHAVVRRSTQ
jgi:hypothetical protein